MDPFAAALDALFNAPGSAAAVHIGVDTGATPIRVISSLRQSELGTVRPRSLTQGAVFDIRKSEVPNANVGDSILVGSVVYNIVVPPESDVEGLVWICDVPELDRQISVQRPSTVLDAHGDEIDAFVEVTSVQGARLDIGAREETSAASADRQANAWRRSIFFIAWSPTTSTIRESDRIVEGSVVYSVESVAEIGTGDGIEITATAKSL